jgi:RimJ/RimL family protein N-acetyltransferase
VNADDAVFRAATEHDLVGLLDLEREANRVALAHVFPPDRYPFPDDAVLTRWQLVLDEPGAEVLVVDAHDRPGLVVFAAYDRTTLRHLAVRPDQWGGGLATRAVDLALAAMRREGSGTASLWCLEDNGRARSLYAGLGWRPTDEVREATWSPHPLERRHTRPTTPLDPSMGARNAGKTGQ